MEKLIGVDVGGTFTDLVLYDAGTGAVATHKVLNSGYEPSQGVMRGISELCHAHGVQLYELTGVLHATTIATNAMLEYDGAPTGFITTEGFRDVLHIGRHQRPQHYSVMQDIPWQARPMVRRRFRRSVRERVVFPGDVTVALVEEDVEAACDLFRNEGISSVAIGFVNSYLNPEHEERARSIVQEQLPDAFVCTSTELFREFREFERFTTAAVNAFIGPKVSDYVARLNDRLVDAGFRGWLHLMMSNGGLATVSAARSKPVTLLQSGPTAGVLGAAWGAGQSNRQRLITFDMGGTSADIGIVDDGDVVEAPARDTWIAGYPVLAPMVDVHTIGAGGGSIAYLDHARGFHVGPRSAGAQPGPASYGNGGTAATVTDAHVVLGRIHPERFLGGDMSLNTDAALEAVSELAQELGMGPYEAAQGIIRVANNAMAAAIRSRTVERGRDPRAFTLVAFGGAGPLHAAELAELLGVPEVLVPAFPGINSAVGLLTTDLRYDQMATIFTLARDAQVTEINSILERLEGIVRNQLAVDGVEETEIHIARAVDCRYAGQGYEIRVPLGRGSLNEAQLNELTATFHAVHKREYGHSFTEDPVELVSVRVTAVGKSQHITALRGEASGALNPERLGRRRGWFETDEGLTEVDVDVYERAALSSGARISGPSIVCQLDTTVLVPPKWTAEAVDGGNLLLRRAVQLADPAASLLSPAAVDEAT